MRKGRGSGVEAGGWGRRATEHAAPPTPPAEPRVPAVAIRAATVQDLDTVVRLRIALLREHAGNAVYGRLRADAPARARHLFAAQLASTREVTFLAERPQHADHAAAGDRTVGILRCIETYGSPLLEPERYGYVASVYVVPQARHGGVLRALLDAAVGWCDRNGLGEIRLHSASDNVTGNAAWSALGFEIAEHLRVRAVHPEHDNGS